MTQDTKVDWGAAIEAWNPVTGETVPMQLEQSFAGRHITVKSPDPSTSNSWWCEDGANRCVGSPWRIRNVPTPTNEIRERMEALTRNVAKYPTTTSNVDDWVAEARAIVALLDPVDPDLIEARKIGRASQYAHDSLNEQLLVEAIKRGRALERRDAA